MIPEDVLKDAVLVGEPTAQALSKIYQHAAQLAKLEQEIEAQEEVLRRLKDDRIKLGCNVLPKLFDEVNTDHVGVPGFNADLVLDIKTHANISVEWDEARRAAGFKEVERLGGQDMIKVAVTVEFGRNEFEDAATFVRHLRGLNWLGGHEIKISKGIHWQTLSKWVGELLDKRVPIDLEKVGGSLSRACRIKWRKVK